MRPTASRLLLAVAFDKYERSFLEPSGPTIQILRMLDAYSESIAKLRGDAQPEARQVGSSSAHEPGGVAEDLANTPSEAKCVSLALRT